MTGQMLYGVASVELDDGAHIRGSGRVYLWSGGQATIYFADRPWVIIPERRIVAIHGIERG